MKSRVITIVMAFVIVTSSFTGCSATTASNSTLDTDVGAETQKGTVKLTVCLPDTQWGSSRDNELQKEVVKELEEKTNTKINCIIPPQGSYKEKVNILVSSGDIPDVFRVFQAMVSLPGFAARGQILPLDDYIKKSPVLSKIDKALYDYMNINEKIYYLPKDEPLTKNIWLRKDVTEKYGVKLPVNASTEQFYTEMKKLAGTEVIPLSLPKFMDNLRFFYNPFGVYDGIYLKDGKYVDGFQVPEVKEALEYIRKLYRDGIIEREFITNENIIMREKIANGKAAADIDYANRYIYYISESNKYKTPTDFFPVYTLVGPQGKSGNLNEAIQNGYVVGARCENVQKAVDFIEYIGFTEEGLKLDHIGVSGKHYVVENGIGIPSEKAMNAGYDWNAGFTILTPVKINMGFRWDEATERGLPQQTRLYEESKRYNGPSFANPAGISDVFDKASPSIKSAREEIATRVVLGALSAEDGIKEYGRFWKSIGGDDILNELNKSVSK